MSQSGDYNPNTGPAEGAVTGLVSDDAVVVLPNPITGDINVFGGTGIATTGNALTYTLTINSTAAGFNWNAISASQTLANKNGYICVGGTNLSLLLPATSIVGDILAISLDGSTSFSVTQAAGQQIRLGDVTTTLGVSGSISSLNQGDSIVLVCKQANTLWTCYGSMGNLTVV